MNVKSCYVVRVACFVAYVVLFAGVVNSQTILMDLGNDESFRGVSVTNPDVNGNYWNSVWSGAYYPNIIDSNGNVTGMHFGFSSAAGTDSFNGPAGTSTNPADSVYNAAALGDMGIDEAVFDFYVTSTFEIQGLDPSKTYNLTFFGSHKYNNDNTTRYTVYTDSTHSTAVASVDLLVGVDDLHNEDTIVSINGLSPQANNILYVGFVGASGGDGYLNTLRIEVVPEPNALILLLLGGFAIGFCRTRKRCFPQVK